MGSPPHPAEPARTNNVAAARQNFSRLPMGESSHGPLCTSKPEGVGLLG